MIYAVAENREEVNIVNVSVGTCINVSRVFVIIIENGSDIITSCLCLKQQVTRFRN